MGPLLAVFAKRPDGSIWLCENGGESWGAWQSWGGQALYSPAACSGGRGRLDVFACGLDRALWHRWRDESGKLNPWTRIGGQLGGSPTATASFEDDRIDVWAQGSDGRVFSATLLYPEGAGAAWTPWLPTDDTPVSAPAAASSIGQFEVVGVGADGAILQTSSDDVGWSSVDALPSGPVPHGTAPSVAIWASEPQVGTAVLIRNPADGQLWARDVIWQPFDTTTVIPWHSWEVRIASAPSGTGTQSGGRVDVAARGNNDGEILHLHRDNVADGITQIEYIGAGFVETPAIVAIPPRLPRVAKPVEWEWLRWGGILRNAETDAWHSGRIVDVLPSIGGSLLVASAHAGIWQLGLTDSTPLSLDWDNSDTTCLADDPRKPGHIYAGCGRVGESIGVAATHGAIYENQPLGDQGWDNGNWREVPVRPDMGSILQLCVVAQHGVLVAGCWGGLFISTIPATGNKYQWDQIGWPDGLPDRTGVFSVSAGPGETVLVGAWDDIDPARRGIYVLSWGAGPLPTLSPSATSAGTWDAMQRISVTTCESLPTRAYALASAVYLDPKGAYNGMGYALLRSNDSGMTWGLCVPILAPPFLGPLNGDDRAGGALHHIHASPEDADVAAFGILRPFATFDGGNTWTDFAAGFKADNKTAIHNDNHAIVFGRGELSTRGYVASDGGLAWSDDFGKTFYSFNNKTLDNLMFYSTFTRGFFGRMTVGATQEEVAAGLSDVVAGGLQDNGNVYGSGSAANPGYRGTTRPDGGSEGGDGGQVVALDNGTFLKSFFGSNAPSVVPRWAVWDTTERMLADKGPVPVLNPDGTTSAQLDWAVMEAVRSPVVRNKRAQSMWGVGAVELTGIRRLYGLFAADDGTDTHWEQITSGDWQDPLIENSISAVGVGDGQTIVVPIKKGGVLQIVSVDAATGVRSAMAALPALPRDLALTNPDGFFNRILVRRNGAEVFMLHNVYPTLANPGGFGTLLRTLDRGKTWKRLGSLPAGNIYGLDEDWTTPTATLYVTTDWAVLRSVDNGENWQPCTANLPRHLHGSDLRFAARHGGERTLYLGTFGWSLWRASL